nr:unnamed protein product [Callosobruchus chinensis]
MFHSFAADSSYTNCVISRAAASEKESPNYENTLNCVPIKISDTETDKNVTLRYCVNLARVDSSSPLCWSQAQEKREGWKPHFCKTTHTQNPQRNTTHRHQPRNSDLFKFFRGRTPGLIAWAVAMNKPG